MLREYAKFDSIHKANEKMLRRMEKYYEDLGDACENKAELAQAFYEQNFDIMLTTNDLLIMFCQVGPRACSTV